MRGREDVDAQGNVQWLYIWKPEVACLLIVRMAPGDYTSMAPLRLLVESRWVVQWIQRIQGS